METRSVLLSPLEKGGEGDFQIFLPLTLNVSEP